MKRWEIFCILIILAALGPAADKADGPYLGQTPPGAVPQLFAPGIVATGMHTRDFTMTPDGREIYFCVILGQYRMSCIVGCRLENGRWSAPRLVPGLDQYQPGVLYFEPHISADGKKFFFASNRPVAGKKFSARDEDIWVMERRGDGWGEPRNLGAPVNTPGGEFFPTTTLDGTLYFTGPDGDGEAIFRSRWLDGKYAAPEKLPAQVNCGRARYNAWFSPDGNLAIVPAEGMADSLGGSDYYAVFRNADDTWSEPVNLGAAINTPDNEHSACLSADGKYFFFMSSRLPAGAAMPARLTYDFIAGLQCRAPNGYPAIYWVDAAFLDKLRPKAAGQK